MLKWALVSNWKKWMKSCVEYHNTPLVNGSSAAPIATDRGLRQGDPLSAFIFTLVGEGLNRLIDKARDLGIVRGF